MALQRCNVRKRTLHPHVESRVREFRYAIFVPRIFHLFSLSFTLPHIFHGATLRESTSGDARACAGGIHYGKCTESSTPYASALMHACILIRGNARVQLPTSPLSPPFRRSPPGLSPPTLSTCVHRESVHIITGGKARLLI